MYADRAEVLHTAYTGGRRLIRLTVRRLCNPLRIAVSQKG